MSLAPYEIKPLGINIRQNDRDVPDGFLQESINLQWRDGAYRPIPERLSSGITDTSGKDEIILHKVSDEDKINVLMFDSGVLKWFGTIENGTYTAKVTPVTITDFPTVTDFDSLSFTILNGLIYFMSVEQQFYYRLQFNEVDEQYEVKDMYAWKDLIPFYPEVGVYNGSFPKGSDVAFLLTRCGIILIRYTLVLNTGEEVLHSPIYCFSMYSINRGPNPTAKGDALKNIHTIINTNLEFADPTTLDEEISAINIYASIPYYKTVFDEFPSASSLVTLVDSADVKGEAQRLADEPFYLIKTLNKPGTSATDRNVLIFVNDFNSDIDYGITNLSKINADTIAAGPVIPVDNFSYHKLYGRITSSNGRLLIDKPTTVLSNGHMRALSIDSNASKQGSYIETEDGLFTGVFDIDKNIVYSGGIFGTKGIISYPDAQGSFAGASEIIAPFNLYLYKLRANKSSNLACAYDFDDIEFGTVAINTAPDPVTFIITTETRFSYGDPDITNANPPTTDPLKYLSENRFQFSESGEFSVWPAINSYRVGDGKIMFVGSNSVDPSNTDYVAPLLIGTTDGIYTVNFDVTGTNLIQSITRSASMPAISSNNVLIDQSLIYISDKGLIVINSGQILNLTRDYFPEQGNGNFPVQNIVYPNYTVLTQEFFGASNPYVLTDIIDYMKGALFAYDGRRNNIWCSNPNQNFSLVYNIDTKQWDMSTYVFSKVIDLFSTLDTSQGDIYSRFLTFNSNEGLDILSGENPNVEVEIHLLTRPIKMQIPDVYKKLQRLYSRCQLYSDTIDAYFTLGVWVKQDINKDKINIPIAAFKDTNFPGNVRQDIPVGRQKGKYKTITVLQGGKVLPESSIDMYELTAISVNNNILR